MDIACNGQHQNLLLPIACRVHVRESVQLFGTISYSLTLSGCMVWPSVWQNHCLMPPAFLLLQFVCRRMQAELTNLRREMFRRQTLSLRDSRSRTQTDDIDSTFAQSAVGRRQEEVQRQAREINRLQQEVARLWQERDAARMQNSTSSSKQAVNRKPASMHQPAVAGDNIHTLVSTIFILWWHFVEMLTGHTMC